MKIYYPVKVADMQLAELMVEHSAILQIHDEIIAGATSDPIVARWANFVPALYDRYKQGLEHMSKQLNVEVFDLWVFTPLAEGAEVVYPDIPEDEAYSYHAEVMLRKSVLDF